MNYSGGIKAKKQRTGKGTGGSEVYEESLFTDNPLAFARLSSDNRIISINDRFEELFQYNLSEIKGKELDLVLAGSEDAASKASHMELGSGLSLAHGYHKLNRRDGEQLDLNFIKVPFPGEGRSGESLVLFKNLTRFKQNEKLLRRQNIRNEKILQTAIDGFCIIDMDGKIIEANRAAAKIYGYPQEDLIGMNVLDFKTEDIREGPTRREIAQKYGSDRFETKHRRVDGRVLDLQFSINFVEMGEGSFFFSFLHDITDLKRAIRTLHDRENALEIKTNNLEEANIAMKVLLERREKDKKELEEKVICNIRELILPNLEKLSKSGLSNTQLGYAKMIEDNLNDIISPFIRRVSSKYLGFTPSELKVADLVRHGKSTKEIADLLNLSVETINSHRSALRKKLGIKNQRINLRTKLLSIRE